MTWTAVKSAVKKPVAVTEGEYTKSAMNTFGYTLGLDVLYTTYSHVSDYQWNSIHCRPTGNIPENERQYYQNWEQNNANDETAGGEEDSRYPDAGTHTALVYAYPSYGVYFEGTNSNAAAAIGVQFVINRRRTEIDKTKISVKFSPVQLALFRNKTDFEKKVFSDRLRLNVTYTPDRFSGASNFGDSRFESVYEPEAFGDSLTFSAWYPADITNKTNEEILMYFGSGYRNPEYPGHATETPGGFDGELLEALKEKTVRVRAKKNYAFSDGSTEID